MLFRNMMRKYYEEAGADGAASGGAGGEPEKTFTAAEVESMIAKAVESAVPEAIKGLKQKNDELISERRKDQERIAREKARVDGKLEEFEASIVSRYEPVIQEKDAKIDAFSSRIANSEKKAILSSFAGDFIAPESKDVISQLVKIDFDGDDVKTQFTDFAGNVITTDPAEFKKWMAKHPAISHLMKADAASGGGAAGGKGAGGAKSFADMTMTEKAILANNDPALYARLSQQK